MELEEEDRVGFLGWIAEVPFGLAFVPNWVSKGSSKFLGGLGGDTFNWTLLLLALYSKGAEWEVCSEFEDAAPTTSNMDVIRDDMTVHRQIDSICSMDHIDVQIV